MPYRLQFVFRINEVKQKKNKNKFQFSYWKTIGRNIVKKKNLHYDRHLITYIINSPYTGLCLDISLIVSGGFLENDE